MPRSRTTQRDQGRVYIANESFVGNVSGVDRQFHQNRTRVREGDEAQVKWPHLFDLLEDADVNQV